MRVKVSTKEPRRYYSIAVHCSECEARIEIKVPVDEESGTFECADCGAILTWKVRTDD